MTRSVRLRRALAVLVAVLALSATAACGDDGDVETGGASEGDGTEESTTTTEATTTTMSAEEAEAAITETTTEFFELLGAGDQDGAIPLMENGEDYREEMLHCEELTLGASIDMKTVEITDDTATMTYDILLNGEVALEDSGGSAVLVDGEWMVAENTFLSLYDAAKDGCTGPPPPDA